MPKARTKHAKQLADDPLWFKDAIIYELHVRAFFDQDGDGIGDFKGLTSKLDYVQELGVNALWLLPFYPSPLRDDGYDTSDYYAVHSRYGTLKDFETFLDEAHRRGIRVITELVVNHTSDQHAWFQRARRARPGSSHRDFYVWNDGPDRYPDARIIFKDFEHSNWSYDAVAKSYYWHRFYSHQPDLNYDNPAVRKAIFQVMDFWLGMGVDGMRLDAVPYLYERDGTDCENLPETHAYLRELRAHVDRNHENRMLLAEANQWPEDAAAYFGAGDECHMNFHFPLMPRLFMALQMEDRFPLLDILRQTPEIGESSQWALFLRNHDELTLEMVTDEERDYMYRAYALDPQARINLGIRRRLAPLLGNNRNAVQLMNALLFSLPGTPVLYYGDELGMGDNIYLGDRNGVRTPMQWSADRNAGFSRANAQSLYLPVIIDPEYHYETINVEAQANNPNSLLWWMRGLIALRKQFKAFGRGEIEFLEPENRKVLAFVRRLGSQAILVVANLSRFVQYVRLDLSEYEGRVPVELFGLTRLPAVSREPYMLTLGAHDFYWLHLREVEAYELSAERPRPLLGVSGPWQDVLARPDREELEELLPDYMRERRWFAGKARTIAGARIRETLAVPAQGDAHFLTFVEVAYDQGDAETYLLPLGFVHGERAHRLAEEAPQAVLSRLISREGEPAEREGLLVDAAYDQRFAHDLLAAIERRRKLKGTAGEAAGTRARSYKKLRGEGELPEARVGTAEQSNSSLMFGDRFALKLYRRVQEGTNPDLEVGRFLSERARFANTPALAGSLEYQSARGRRATLGTLQAFVPNEGDAWRYAVDAAERALESAATHPGRTPPPPPFEGKLIDACGHEVPAAVRDLTGPFLESARLLGRRTAEMHVALASDADDPDFAPERFTPSARRSVSQSFRTLAKRAFLTLRGELPKLPPPARELAGRVLPLEDELLAKVRSILDRRLASLRTRTHGDYHLGQVLHTGRDFVIIDFEGEPARPIGERRLKRSPLRDVAGMLRSFHYAARVALDDRLAKRLPDPGLRPALEEWAHQWRFWVGAQFLDAYLEAAGSDGFLAGAGREEIDALLAVYRMEKAVYELGYEVSHRPDWVAIPLAGILQVWSEV